MDPYAFEHLVKRRLQEMNYDNVEVTTRSNDGGVDVVADIELASSSGQATQAHNPKKGCGCPHGSLYRFNAVRGTIIATSNFSSGTQDAAFANGAAPITLIDGDKLIDLLIEHGIGVKKHTIEVLAVDPDAFSDLVPEA